MFPVLFYPKRLRLPKSDAPVLAGRGQELPVRTELEPVNARGMMCQLRGPRIVTQIPKANRPIRPGRGHRSSLLAEREPQDNVFVRAQSFHFLCVFRSHSFTDRS